jgi:hypothetical protein
MFTVFVGKKAVQGDKGRMFARKHYISCLLIIGIVYVLFYGWMLVAGNGLPYVMDNNESFSSWWHAYNLFHFDLTKSAGLADESFAFHAAAHPYIHTHQGNFPRLFSYLLVVLGANSIESQIAITTFTVGAAAFFMAYHFFTKITNPLFALVCCLLLITDYVLVAQWQVVTYRVWHGFFVFSSMLCVHWMVEKRRYWAVATVVNFACLFYYELVFVAFVSLSSALYAAILCRQAHKRVVGFWMLQTLGGLVALSVLVMQLYLYLGWDSLKTDLYLTFVARNQYQNSALLLQRMQEFFESRNIVFWYNLADGSAYRTIEQFFTSLLHFEFQIHTPFLALISVIGALTLFVVPRFRHVPAAAGMAAEGGGLPRGVRSEVSRFRIADANITALLFLAFFELYVTLFGKESILGAPASIRHLFLPADLTHFSMALIAAGCACVLLNRACRVSYSSDCIPAGAGHYDLTVMLRVLVFLLLVTLFVAGNWMLYEPRYVPLWRDFANQYLPGPLPELVIILVVMLACAAIIAKNNVFRELGLVPAIRGCGLFFLAGIGAYAVVYLLSPGYIFSGYRFRYAPFTVFHTTVVPALLLYVLLVAGMKYLPPSRFGKAVNATFKAADAAATPGYRWISMPAMVGVASLTTFCILTSYWIGMQVSYIRLLPPNHYSFLQKLSKPPYVGKTFLVNTYSAPIAATTGAWAYLNVKLKSTEPVISGDSYKFPSDTAYLWFADKNTNPDYAHPEYFLCITMQSVSTVLQEALRRKRRGEGNAGCERNQLVQLVRRGEGKFVYPALELLESDQQGPEVVGYERWAIVKLNWK